nr:hypothetical protein [uncultured Methanospirillum sp.]
MMADDHSPGRGVEHEPEKSIPVNVPVPFPLLVTLDAAAGLMEISREEMILMILTRWGREQTLPLYGEDKLCSLKPGSDIS